MDADAIVIGGGIVGLTTTFQLARSGRRVVLVDRARPGAEASGRNGGHISPGVDGGWAELGRRALVLWPTLAAELGDVEFRRAGGLYVVMANDAVEPHELASHRRARGFLAEAVDAERCRSLLPPLAHDIKGGVLSSDRAQVNPQAVMARMTDAARDMGVTVWHSTTVTAIEVQHDEVRGVRTTSGSVSSGAVLVSAGPWTGEVAQLAGVDVHVRAQRIQMFVTEAVPRFTDMLWAGNGLYGRQAVTGQLHVGAEGPAWDPPAERFDHEVTAPTLQRIARRLSALMPGLADVCVLRAWAGIINHSADGFPIIDALARPRGLIVAAGMGGNGFGVGAVVGCAIAELVERGTTDLDLAPYRLARFASEND